MTESEVREVSEEEIAAVVDKAISPMCHDCSVDEISKAIIDFLKGKNG